MRLRGLIKWAVLLLAIVLFGLTAIPSLPNWILALFFFFSSLAASGLFVTFAGVSPAFAEAVRAMYQPQTGGT